MCVANIRCVGLWDYQKQICNRAMLSNRLCHGRAGHWLRLRHSETRSHLVDRNGGTGFSLLISPIANAELIKLATFFKAIHAEAFVQFMLFIVGDGVSEGGA